ncbi:MAG: hypothetical protein Q8R92_18520 [Deltaproteobacteria bacterium]|nr:hypothetical protein [Deltaproteobacteria bacterium]
MNTTGECQSCGRTDDLLDADDGLCARCAISRDYLQRHHHGARRRRVRQLLVAGGGEKTGRVRRRFPLTAAPGVFCPHH